MKSLITTPEKEIRGVERRERIERINKDAREREARTRKKRKRINKHARERERKRKEKKTEAAGAEDYKTGVMGAR